MGHISKALFGDLLAEGSNRVWDECRPWWPHKNIFTGKWMNPFKIAARARIRTEHGDTSILYMEYIAYWTTPQDLIIQKLKGNA